MQSKNDRNSHGREEAMAAVLSVVVTFIDEGNRGNYNRPCIFITSAELKLFLSNSKTAGKPTANLSRMKRTFKHQQGRTVAVQQMHLA